MQPRTRTYKERTRGNGFPDKSAEKAAQRKRILEEERALRARLDACIRDGRLDFRALNAPLSPEVLMIFLNWIHQASQDSDRRGCTQYGQFYTLRTRDGPDCVVHCTEGTLTMPDCVLVFDEDTPDSGEILTPPGRRTAVVFQEPRLLPWLTVEKNIAFGLARRETTREKMDALLELTGLTAFARAKPAQLSGGMEQRAAIARALAVEPDFLLMDEPFAALDALTRETMREALRGILARRPCGVLFITHSVEEGLALGDRLFLLRDGQLSALPALSARENPDPVELAARKAEILAQLG